MTIFRWVVRGALVILDFLLWETAIVGVPGSILGQVGWLNSLDAGLWRIVAALLAVGVALLAIGPVRLAEWRGKLSDLRQPTRSHSNTPPEIRAQERWREQDALEKYIAQMREWLDNSDAPLEQLPPEHPHYKSAQEDTKRILKKLSPSGKREVVSFLHSRGLIKVGVPIISLVRADLSEAELSDLGLVDASLSYADLRGANLSGTRLCNLQATLADMSRGLKRRDEKRSYLDLASMELSEPTAVSHLIHCDLSGAILRQTRLAGCILHYANLAGAELGEADIRAADLRGALNLTQEQIESAYGSRGQEGIVVDTLLPDHLEAPLKWKLPLKQQQEARRRRS